MGVRGEIFSNRIILPNRTYFFNVKENRMGDLYLNIVESKNRESGGFDRQSVVLFADDLQEFLKGFDESLRVMEKAVREKRQSGGEKPKRKSGFSGRDEKDGKPKQRQNFNNEKDGFPKQRRDFNEDRDGRPKQRHGFSSERDGHPKHTGFSGERDRNSKQRQNFRKEGGHPKQRKDFGGEKRERGFRGHKSENGPNKNRRVVVRKNENNH